MSAPRDASQRETIVCENARLELLRALAWSRDYMRAERAKRGDSWPGHDFVPLFCGEFQNAKADILLAAKEAHLRGEIQLTRGAEPWQRTLDDLQGPPVCITDAGYDWIRARDMIGEAEQEGGLASGGQRERK